MYLKGKKTVNAKQTALVQQSFQKILPIADTAAILFYDRLFALDPSIRCLFKGNMQFQGRMLMQTIGLAVKGLHQPETILSTVQELGKRHKAYGVKEEHFDTVGAALLWTLEQGLEEEFTPEIRESWAAAYSLLANVMKEAAAQDD